MPSTTSKSPRTPGLGQRFLVPLALCLATALPATAAGLPTSSTGSGSERGANCPHQFDRPNEATAAQLREAMVCLIAYERRRADRRELRENSDLTRVASRHTRTMLDKECFRHTCAGEPSLERRILRSGYLRAGDSYGYAENIGCANTPRAQVNTWMDSTEHRRNILGRRYRHIGAGAGKGAPRGCARDRGYATYTVIFAWRSR